MVKLVRGCHQQAIAGFGGLLGAPGAQIARVIVRYFGSNRLKMAKIRHVRAMSRPGVVWARHLSSGAEHGAQASYSIALTADHAARHREVAKRALGSVTLAQIGSKWSKSDMFEV